MPGHRLVVYGTGNLKFRTSGLDEQFWAGPAGSFVSSTVQRVLDILETVADAARPLSPSEIADLLQVPKASVYRLCASLEERGFLQTRLNARGLQAGQRLRKLAVGVLTSETFQAQRRAILGKLSEEIGETCNIAVPDGVEMIYFDRAETHWPVRVQLQIGSRVPAAATAGGKMYLSTLPRAKRERVIANVSLTAHTANTLVEHAALSAELEMTAERDFATDNEEYIQGMVALAVPMRDSRQRLYATLSFHAPCMRISFDTVTDYLPLLRAASDKLTGLLDE